MQALLSRVRREQVIFRSAVHGSVWKKNDRLRLCNGLRRGVGLSQRHLDGGVAIENYVHGGSNLSVRGGRFEAVAGDWLFAMTETFPDNTASTLKICGGQFGYSEQGTGLLIDGKTDLHVYGSNLAVNAGRLQGTLQDGSSIDVALTFGSNWIGAFTLNNAPTSSTPNC